jgi:ATP-dependent helicase/nuclease subunit A
MIKRNDATAAQVRAADPNVSTWLSANAGSGKTRVLTDRVARLLLEGTNPQHILCLTYTKAAASEMQNRLFKRLGAWAMMDNDTLQSEMVELGVEGAIDAGRLSLARTLFAGAIETPGGLKIQTIHSFCSSLLRRFPLEAGVSPQFVEMEERSAKMLRAEVVDQIALGENADVVDGLARHFTGEDFNCLTEEIARNKSAFSGPEPASDMFELSHGTDRTNALKIAFIGGEDGLVNDACDILANLSKSYSEVGVALKSVNLDTPTLASLNTLFGLFLYQSGVNQGTSKSANWPQIRHKKAVEAFEPVAADFHALMDRVADARDYILCADAYEKTLALHAFAREFIPAYEAKKLRKGWLDFDDLILKAQALLTDERVAQWVLFRLDGGIDHILVDEAQDTSPAQWAVIENLAQEFTSGLGARDDQTRTIFVVGDKKQSIYSFQGADPRAFDEMHDLFKKRLGQIEIPLVRETLEHSFRSSEPILRLVDVSFAGERSKGLDQTVSHKAFHTDMPGRVDLWPVIEKSEDPEEKDWFDPIDLVGEDHHTVRLADAIANEIARMVCDETLPFDDKGTIKRRAITEGDVLILVQRRNAIFHEIIRACKAKGLAVAGADRLKVGAELAVKDITSLLAFLALPEDNLALAEALKSPIFGWNEQDLYDLAHKRKAGNYLGAELRKRSSEFPQTMSILDDLEKQADFLRPYDLIERLLVRHGGRHKLLARLGVEAEDGIDALLSQALSYERTAVPSLTGFLEWMATDALEIKRQMDASGNKIRVMTTHGAKGLEAPIVFLPDTGKRKLEFKPELIQNNDSVIWKTSAETSPLMIQTLKSKALEKEQEERKRLLYVAMTRAEKWLVICAAGDVGKNDESWYLEALHGIENAGGEVQNFALGQGIRLSNSGWDDQPLVVNTPASDPAIDIPKFVTTPTAPREKPASTIAPSELGGAKALQGEPGHLTQDDVLRRGRLIHSLLEHLPTTPESMWSDLADALFLSGEEPFDPVEAKELKEAAIKTLKTDALAHLFSPDALAEVDITATLSQLGGRRVHGAIDRLLIDETRVLAVDYKSNRLIPDSPETVPNGVLRQLGAYAAALALIYPNHKVEVAVLWTQTAELMVLPHDLVMGALETTTFA